MPSNSRGTLVWQMRNGFVYKVEDNKLAIAQGHTVQCYWEFPDSISRVSCCHDLNSAVGAFVLTVDGTLWKVDWVEKCNDTEPPTKRVKYTQTSSEDAIVFQASRDQVIADALLDPILWIQTYTLKDILGCLVYGIDGSLVFCPIKGTPSSITSRQTVDSNFITSNDFVSQAYVPGSSTSAAMHCDGNRVDAVVFGTKKGKVYYKAIDHTKEVCVLDHPETIQSIHAISNVANDIDVNTEAVFAVLVVSIEGSLTVAYAAGSPAKLNVDEACISSPIAAAAVSRNRLYTISTNNIVYEVTSGIESDQEVQVKEVAVGRLSNETRIVGMSLPDENTLNDPHLVGILETGKLIDIAILQTQVRESDPAVLQEEIQKTLREIGQCQQAQAKLDKAHQFLNSMLVEYNLTVHKLQRLLRAKSKPLASTDGNTPLFVCNIKPRVTDPTLRTLIPLETLLRIELKSEISMKWAEHWQLCIEMDPCSPLMDGPQSDTRTPGALYTCALDDMKASVLWERDFPVHIEQLGLPLYVNVNLVFTPYSHLYSDQPDGTIESQILFPVHGILLDMVCYAMPCEGPAKTGLDFRARKVATAASSYPSSHIYTSAMKKSTAVTRSLGLCVSGNTSPLHADEHSHRILSTILAEGIDGQLLEQILIRPDCALFTLPLCRKTPVSLTIRPRSSLTSNDDGQTPKFDIVIECSHPFILLKTFQAIAMRLSFIISDTEEGMKGVDEKCYIGDVKNLHYDLHQDIRDLEELFLDDMVENLDEIARAYGVLSERYLPVDLGFIR